MDKPKNPYLNTWYIRHDTWDGSYGYDGHHTSYEKCPIALTRKEVVLINHVFDDYPVSIVGKDDRTDDD